MIPSYRASDCDTECHAVLLSVDNLQEKYNEALALAPEKAAQQRAVYFANSAAVHLKLQQYAEAAKDASAALDLEPSTSLRIKALTRRSNAYEKLDDLDRALMDMEKVITVAYHSSNR